MRPVLAEQTGEKATFFRRFLRRHIDTLVFFLVGTCPVRLRTGGRIAELILQRERCWCAWRRGSHGDGVLRGIRIIRVIWGLA